MGHENRSNTGKNLLDKIAGGEAELKEKKELEE